MSCCRSRCVAEITRTFTGIASVLPTGRITFSCSTRSSFTCRRGGMSPISSSISVPPSAAWNRPRCARVAPVNEPFSWPKSSDSSRFSAIALQLMATNGLLLARARAMDRARQQLLARAALAGDEHARIGAGHHVRLRELLFHRGAARDDLRAPVFVGGAEAGDAQRLLHLVEQLLLVDRLGEEAERAHLRGLHRIGNRAVRGEDDDLQSGPAVLQLLQQPDAVHLVHAQVGDDEVGAEAARGGERQQRRFPPPRRRSSPRAGGWSAGAAGPGRHRRRGCVLCVFRFGSQGCVLRLKSSGSRSVAASCARSASARCRQSHRALRALPPAPCAAAHSRLISVCRRLLSAVALVAVVARRTCSAGGGSPPPASAARRLSAARGTRARAPQAAASRAWPSARAAAAAPAADPCAAWPARRAPAHSAADGSASARARIRAASRPASRPARRAPLCTSCCSSSRYPVSTRGGGGGAVDRGRLRLVALAVIGEAAASCTQSERASAAAPRRQDCAQHARRERSCRMRVLLAVVLVVGSIADCSVA